MRRSNVVLAQNLDSYDTSFFTTNNAFHGLTPDSCQQLLGDAQMNNGGGFNALKNFQVRRHLPDPCWILDFSGTA